MAKNADLIRRWFEEVWNQGRGETIHKMCAKDAIGYGQAQHGADIHGPNISSNFGEPSAEHSQESKSRFSTPLKKMTKWSPGGP